MDFRKLHGEEITGESWLVRNTWKKLDRTHSHRVGMANLPKFFSATATRNIVNDAWRAQGVRDLLDTDKDEKDMNSNQLIVLESILKLNAS